MIEVAITENDRVRLTRNVERFPHFIARAGMVGTVTEATEEIVCIKMDEHLDGAEEWDNEVVWTPEDEYPGPQQNAMNAAVSDVEHA